MLGLEVTDSAAARVCDGIGKRRISSELHRPTRFPAHALTLRNNTDINTNPATEQNKRTKPTATHEC